MPSTGKSVPRGIQPSCCFSLLYMYALRTRFRPNLWPAQYMSLVACVGWTDGMIVKSAKA